MKKFGADFRDFAVKGNALALAVGIIIGAAFGGIVNSLANDIIMPIVGMFFKTDFTQMAWTYNESTINYGSFIAAVINFIILAFVIFMLVRLFTKMTATSKNKPGSGDDSQTPENS